MNTCPLISICIPTYNRAEILEKTIQKIVSYKNFDAEVELVISDNCSTDNTEDVVKQYSDRYDNIRYFRNKENIRDLNFIKVLDMGRGQYLKLMNDWFFPTDDGLLIMKNFIKEHIDKRIPIFFTSGWIRGDKTLQTSTSNNLDDFVKIVSVMVTSNNVFGAWKSDWDEIKQKSRYSELKLLQVDWSYSIVSHKGFLICNAPILKSNEKMHKTKRQGFNYFEVICNNYYTIMQRYVEDGKLLQSTMEEDKKYFLRHFRPELFQALIWNSSKYWKYDTEGTWKLMYNKYKSKPYFYLFIATLPFQWIFHASVRDFWR